MTDKDALELLNMFTIAAQLAKSRNTQEFHLKMNETVLVELLKKAFPAMKNNVNIVNIAKNILKDWLEKYMNFIPIIITIWLIAFIL